jgi:hypothetical protein
MSPAEINTALALTRIAVRTTVVVGNDGAYGDG